jgi:hypothetical protein
MERRMRNQAVNTDVILNSMARPKTRSSLFWWLFDNHAAIAQRAEGRRLDWTELCTTFRDHELTDLDGKAPTVDTARMTWWRVRKEYARVEVLRAAERTERERRTAANPRRNMSSQFPKGDYGPSLASTAEAARPKLPATTVEQASRGFQLSTAEGVVVTRVSRVFKTEKASQDYVFKEDGMIAATTARASALKGKQQLNVRGAGLGGILLEAEKKMGERVETACARIEEASRRFRDDEIRRAELLLASGQEALNMARQAADRAAATGVAHHETIRTFHSARFMEDPLAVQCNLIGNPLHEEQLEIVRGLGDVYALNTVIDDERALAYVNFGEPVMRRRCNSWTRPFACQRLASSRR